MVAMIKVVSRPLLFAKEKSPLINAMTLVYHVFFKKGVFLFAFQEIMTHLTFTGHLDVAAAVQQ